MKRGTFITFEGMEGSGKSTQVAILSDRLKAAGRGVVLTREPGGTAAGEAIRKIVKGEGEEMAICPETEMLLFAASRAQLVREVILPALKRGDVVVSDRFADSTTVYQGIARGLDTGDIAALNRLVMSKAVPDITILLDVEVGLGLKRVHRRSKKSRGRSDRIERENAMFHKKVRDGYRQLARKSSGRIRVVDGARSQELVARSVWEIVSDALD
ncbi:MAG: dTMP kinase [bacterium]